MNNYYRNKINSIIKKNYNHENPDYLRSKELCKAISGMLQNMFQGEIIGIRNNEVYCSPSYFLIFNNGNTIYVSFSDYRYENWDSNILYRTAKDITDYYGGTNNYCSLDNLYDCVVHLANR